MVIMPETITFRILLQMCITGALGVPGTSRDRTATQCALVSSEIVKYSLDK